MRLCEAWVPGLDDVVTAEIMSAAAGAAAAAAAQAQGAGREAQASAAAEVWGEGQELRVLLG